MQQSNDGRITARPSLTSRSLTSGNSVSFIIAKASGACPPAQPSELKLDDKALLAQLVTAWTENMVGALLGYSMATAASTAEEAAWAQQLQRVPDGRDRGV